VAVVRVVAVVVVVRDVGVVAVLRVVGGLIEVLCKVHTLGVNF